MRRYNIELKSIFKHILIDHCFEKNKSSKFLPKSEELPPKNFLVT